MPRSQSLPQLINSEAAEAAEQIQRDRQRRMREGMAQSRMGGYLLYLEQTLHAKNSPDPTDPSLIRDGQSRAREGDTRGDIRTDIIDEHSNANQITLNVGKSKSNVLTRYEGDGEDYYSGSYDEVSENQDDSDYEDDEEAYDGYEDHNGTVDNRADAGYAQEYKSDGVVLQHQRNSTVKFKNTDPSEHDYNTYSPAMINPYGGDFGRTRAMSMHSSPSSEPRDSFYYNNNTKNSKSRNNSLTSGASTYSESSKRKAHSSKNKPHNNFFFTVTSPSSNLKKSIPHLPAATTSSSTSSNDNVSQGTTPNFDISITGAMSSSSNQNNTIEPSTSNEYLRRVFTSFNELAASAKRSDAITQFIPPEASRLVDMETKFFFNNSKSYNSSNASSSITTTANTTATSSTTFSGASSSSGSASNSLPSSNSSQTTPVVVVALAPSTASNNSSGDVHKLSTSSAFLQSANINSNFQKKERGSMLSLFKSKSKDSSQILQSPPNTDSKQFNSKSIKDGVSGTEKSAGDVLTFQGLKYLKSNTFSKEYYSESSSISNSNKSTTISSNAPSTDRIKSVSTDEGSMDNPSLSSDSRVGVIRKGRSKLIDDMSATSSIPFIYGSSLDRAIQSEKKQEKYVQEPLISNIDYAESVDNILKPSLLQNDHIPTFEFNEFSQRQSQSSATPIVKSALVTEKNPELGGTLDRKLARPHKPKKSIAFNEDTIKKRDKSDDEIDSSNKPNRITLFFRRLSYLYYWWLHEWWFKDVYPINTTPEMRLAIYFQRRELPKYRVFIFHLKSKPLFTKFLICKATLLQLIGLGIGAVITGKLGGWNSALSYGGFGGFLVANWVAANMYLCLCLCLTEMSLSIPVVGGSFAYSRVIILTRNI